MAPPPPPPPPLYIPLINKPYRHRLSWSTSDLHEPSLPHDGSSCHERSGTTKLTTPSKWGHSKMWGVGKKGKEKEADWNQISSPSQVNIPSSLDQSVLRRETSVQSRNKDLDNRNRPTTPRLNPPSPSSLGQQPHLGPQTTSNANFLLYQPAVRQNLLVRQSREANYRKNISGTDKPLPPLNIDPRAPCREDLPLYHPDAPRDVSVEIMKKSRPVAPGNRYPTPPARPTAPPPAAGHGLFLQIPSNGTYRPPYQSAVRRDPSGQSIRESPGNISRSTTPKSFLPYVKIDSRTTGNGVGLSVPQHVVQQNLSGSHSQDTHWRNRNISVTDKPLPPLTIDTQTASQKDIPLFRPTTVQPDLSRQCNEIHRSDTRGRSAKGTPVNPEPPSFSIKPDNYEPIRIKPNTSSCLDEMRRLLTKFKLDYYIVPSGDSHGSQYVAPSDRRLEFMSGYTGSPGHAIISSSSACLFTSPKDWTRAEEEIDHNWTMIKRECDGEPQNWIDWMETRIETGSVIGVDARLISLETATLINKNMKDKCSKLVHPPQNLVDLIWAEKPRKSLEKIYPRDMESSGRDALNKLEKVTEWIRLQNRDSPSKPEDGLSSTSDAHVATLVTSPNCIAFLLNLRGSDTIRKSFCPGYLFVSLEKNYLFVEPESVQGEAIHYLNVIGVQQRRYKDLWTFLRRKEWGEGKVLIAPQTSYAIALMLTHARYTLAPSYVEQMISIKNQNEIDSMRGAYLRGVVSFVRFLGWLEEKLEDGHDITEYEALSRDSGAQYLDRKLNPISVEDTKDPSTERPQRVFGGIASSNIAHRNQHRHFTDNLLRDTEVVTRDRSNSSRLGPQYEPSIPATGTTGINESLQEGLRPRRPTSIDALDLASTTTSVTLSTAGTVSRYSKASSRTESTDYGIFYTRRAYSEETLNIQ